MLYSSTTVHRPQIEFLGGDEQNEFIQEWIIAAKLDEPQVNVDKKT